MKSMMGDVLYLDKSKTVEFVNGESRLGGLLTEIDCYCSCAVKPRELSDGNALNVLFSFHFAKLTSVSGEQGLIR